MTRSLRENYLKLVETSYGLERDLLTNDFNKFASEINLSGSTQMVIGERHIGRPDLISLETYGTPEYWWFIMKLNSIEDVWNELYEGLVVVCPSIELMEAYFTKYRDM